MKNFATYGPDPETLTRSDPDLDKEFRIYKTIESQEDSRGEHRTVQNIKFLIFNPGEIYPHHMNINQAALVPSLHFSFTLRRATTFFDRQKLPF
jgi:hypothetical protein